ncbi:CopG family transcriptional regulator [Rhodoplanes elegans]|uniref:ribbon-helix-helix domain-containing protein n=1 Tax=Rhodoplanes elegans TaxID=29408 RepID=UPI0011B93B94|nr:CopG family transcriptional regulator [Rhodoplanes elegans]
MKTLTVRLPDALVSEIETESRLRNVSKSDVVRERLTARPEAAPAGHVAIADLVGSVDGLPPDLSSNTKAALKASGYGRKHSG